MRSSSTGRKQSPVLEGAIQKNKPSKEREPTFFQTEIDQLQSDTSAELREQEIEENIRETAGGLAYSDDEVNSRSDGDLEDNNLKYMHDFELDVTDCRHR